MPRLGLSKNLTNIDAKFIDKFMGQHFTPGNCLIVASGVRDHQEFLDLCTSRLNDLPAGASKTREPAEYIGGQNFSESDTPTCSITLAFESCSWASEDV